MSTYEDRRVVGDELAVRWQALGLGDDELRVYTWLLSGQRAGSRAALARALALPVRRVATALAWLADRGFTVPSPGRAALPRPIAPAAALRNLIHLHQAELLRRSAALEELTGSVDQVTARLLGDLHDAKTAGIETVRGREAIGQRVASLMASAQTELALLDRPPYATSAPDGMPAPLDVGGLVKRGVQVRVVVDREGLRFPGRARGLNDLSGEGVQIRVGTDLPTKLITVDRRVTLLPPTEAADPTATALVVSDSLLNHTLTPLFEAVWERSLPIGAVAHGDIGDGTVTEEDRELLTMLAAGLKDEAIARRLGVHVHTVRRRITRLMQVLNVDTRFQAGVQATLKGWLTA